MNLNQFAAFRAVMLTGTVSGAAEVLGRSQPAVSRLLDRLEYDLGLSLFERRRGRITPTPEAYLLLDEIERAYVSLESLDTMAFRLAKGEGTHVNIAIMPALGINFMPPILARFHQDWPKTKVTFNVRMSVKIEELAAAQQIDFGLAEIPFKRSGFETEMFSQGPYVVAVPSGHPFADREYIEPRDLQDGPFISWTSFVPVRQLLNRVLEEADVKVDAAFETTYSIAAYELVKRGLGIAIIDPYTAVQQLDENAVLVPFIPKIPFNVALLRPESRGASPATEAMLAIAAEERDRLLGQLPEHPL